MDTDFSVFEWLNIAGAIGTMGMGLFGLLLPKKAANFVGLVAVTPVGTSEFRATYGGLWLALGLAPIITQNPLAYAVAGLCWFGAAFGRVVSIFVDKTNVSKNWAAVIFECFFGGLLVVGAPWNQIFY